MVRNIKFKVSLSMERIADTNGRNIRSLCTLRYTCFNTKSWFLSRFWTKMGHPIYSQMWPDKRFKTLCSMTACTLSLSVGRFSFCISGHQILYCVGCELCGQKTAEYQYCNLTPCIQCLCKIYSNTIHNQAVNIIIKHISSILTKYSANILTWRIRGLEKLSHSGLTPFLFGHFPSRKSCQNLKYPHLTFISEPWRWSSWAECLGCGCRGVECHLVHDDGGNESHEPRGQGHPQS